MPELPEVETIKNDLEKKIVGKNIVRVEVKLARLVSPGVTAFRKKLEGNAVTAVRRIGKMMVFELRRGPEVLLVHLKMTGQLIFCQGGKVIAGGHSLPKVQGCLPNKFTRVVFGFADGSHLFFNDMRTFGYMKLADERGLAAARGAYGVDPFLEKLTLEKMESVFAGRTAPVKAVLLNQKLIAGIGNIYADEILFAAQVRPDRRTNTLMPAEIKAIRAAIGQVLRRAVKYRGTTFNDYVDADGNMGNFEKHLRVYGRAGKPCLRCGGTVAKMKTAGRGTSFCMGCQD